MRAIAAAMMLLACLTDVNAQEEQIKPDECVSVSAFLRQTEGAVRGARRLAAAESRRVVAWYNASPPVTTHQFDVVILVLEMNGSVSLFFGSDNKVCFGDAVPPHVLDGLGEAISGQGGT